MISIGQRIPGGTLYESVHDVTQACSLAPVSIAVPDAMGGKRVVVFGVPGAFTPTCSASHLPGYVRLHEEFARAGIDEIWCHSVNDAYVMAAWGVHHSVGQKVRMVGDGAACWAMALGLEQDLTTRGLGLRVKRYAMVVDDGIVTQLYVEAPGQFAVSSAESVLEAIKEAKVAQPRR